MFPRVFRLIFNGFYVWKISTTQLDPIYCINHLNSQRYGIDKGGGGDNLSRYFYDGDDFWFFVMPPDDTKLIDKKSLKLNGYYIRI